MQQTPLHPPRHVALPKQHLQLAPMIWQFHASGMEAISSGCPVLVVHHWVTSVDASAVYKCTRLQHLNTWQRHHLQLWQNLYNTCSEQTGSSPAQYYPPFRPSSWQPETTAHAGTETPDAAGVADALHLLAGLCKVPVVNQLAGQVAGHDAAAEEASGLVLPPPSPSYSANLRHMEDEEAPFPRTLLHSRSLPAEAVSPHRYMWYESRVTYVCAAWGPTTPVPCISLYGRICMCLNIGHSDAQPCRLRAVAGC